MWGGRGEEGRKEGREGGRASSPQYRYAMLLFFQHGHKDEVRFGIVNLLVRFLVWVAFFGIVPGWLGVGLGGSGKGGKEGVGRGRGCGLYLTSMAYGVGSFGRSVGRSVGELEFVKKTFSFFSLPFLHFLPSILFLDRFTIGLCDAGVGNLWFRLLEYGIVCEYVCVCVILE